MGEDAADDSAFRHEGEQVLGGAGGTADAGEASLEEILPGPFDALRRSPRHRLGQLASAPEGVESTKIVMRDGRVFQGTALQNARTTMRTTSQSTQTTTTVSQAESRYGTAEPKIELGLPKGTIHRLVSAALHTRTTDEAGLEIGGGHPFEDGEHDQRDGGDAPTPSDLQEGCARSRDANGERDSRRPERVNPEIVSDKDARSGSIDLEEARRRCKEHLQHPRVERQQRPRGDESDASADHGRAASCHPTQSAQHNEKPGDDAQESEIVQARDRVRQDHPGIAGFESPWRRGSGTVEAAP